MKSHICSCLKREMPDTSLNGHARFIKHAKVLESDRIRWLEIMAVVITGSMKYILMDWLNLRAIYIGGACLFWIIFIYKRYHKDNAILRHWGFRKAHFKRTFLLILPFALTVIAGIVWYGIAFNATFLNWHVIPVLVLYPFWGIIQQFMMLALIARNLRSISSLNLKDPQVIVLTSLLFALAHYPSFPLMVFAFVMEIGFTSMYFKWKNLWALGLYHGWIGGLLLFFVMNRDLWIELWPVI